MTYPSDCSRIHRIIFQVSLSDGGPDSVAAFYFFSPQESCHSCAASTVSSKHIENVLQSPVSRCYGISFILTMPGPLSQRSQLPPPRDPPTNPTQLKKNMTSDKFIMLTKNQDTKSDACRIASSKVCGDCGDATRHGCPAMADFHVQLSAATIRCTHPPIAHMWSDNEQIWRDPKKFAQKPINDHAMCPGDLSQIQATPFHDQLYYCIIVFQETQMRMTGQWWDRPRHMVNILNE